MSMEHIFVQSLLSGERLFAYKLLKRVYTLSLLTKEKDPIEVHIILAEDKVVKTLQLLHRSVKTFHFSF